MKVYFVTLFFFSFSFSSFFNDFAKIEPNNDNNQKIMKSLNQTENNIKIYKNIINNILIGCILTSAGVSYLLYNSINNPYVAIELGYNNHNESLEEINDSLKIGFVLNIIITCILIYTYYKYNITQENIEQEIQKITLEDLIL